MLDRADEALALVRAMDPEIAGQSRSSTTDNHDVSIELLFALTRAGDQDKARRLLAAENAHQARDHATRPRHRQRYFLARQCGAVGASQRPCAC